MKKIKLRISRNHIKAIAAVFFVIAIFLTAIYYNSPKPPSEFVTNKTFEKSFGIFFVYEITRLPCNVEIVSANYDEGKLKIGFAVDPWNLNFGVIPIGNYGVRHLLLNNSENKNVRVSIAVYGTISPLVKVSKNNFVLRSGESESVDVFLDATDLTTPGNYSGEVDIIIKKPIFGFMEWFI